MIIKVCQYKARQEQGERLVQVFQPGDIGAAADFFSMGKIASPLLPDVQQFLDKLKKDPNKIYVLVNALGAGEFWGCFPEGAPVQTKRGWVPIEHVLVGEEVLTHQNRWRPVTATQVRDHKGELWELEIAGLPRHQPYVSATPNHEMRVVLRDELIRARRKHLYKRDKDTPRGVGREKFLQEVPFDWAAICDLREGDYVVQPFPVEEDKDTAVYKKWGSHGIAEMAGLYAAEGCVANRYDKDMLPETDPCYKVIYTLGPDEYDAVDMIKRVAGDFGYNPTVRVEDNYIRVEVCWSELARFFRDHIGHHATEKFLANDLLTMPTRWQQDFFRWYAKGDGCTRGSGKGEGTVRCVSASLQLLYDARLMVARLGKVGQISGRYNTASSFYNGNPIFEMAVSGSQWEGRDTSNVEGYIHPDGYILSPVRKVSSRPFTGSVYNIEVEEDESYTVGGLAVHNSNINGDYFPEVSLIHEGPDFGYKTFYNAHPFKHHVNKDPDKSFGDVVLAVWHPDMKRVELIIAIDRTKARELGAEDVCDKLDRGMFPDVSMGCKVPYDLCSVCTDWKKYRKAQATFNSALHPSVGKAVLAYHMKDPIRGLSPTRDVYCDHLRHQLNKILPDGRKVYMINTYPRFFDISFVFIGADKTAKVMAKLACAHPEWSGDVVPTWYIADTLGYRQPSTDKGFEKVAGGKVDRQRRLAEMAYKDIVGNPPPKLVPRSLDILGTEKRSGVEYVRDRLREKSASHAKWAEIIKSIVPSQFGGKASVVLDRAPKDLPDEVLDQLGKSDLASALSTPTSMGMILKPREFQRITIIRLGKKPLADALDRDGELFSPTDDEDRSIPMGGHHFHHGLMRKLLPFLGDRSCFEPVVRRKIIRITICPKPELEDDFDPKSVENDDLLHKISAAYNGYLDRVVDCLRNSEQIVDENPELWSEVYGVNAVDGFTKEAAGVNPKVLLGAIGAGFAATQFARWQREKARMGSGPSVGPVMDFIAENPKTVMFLAGMGALHQQGSDIPKRLIRGAIGGVKSALGR